MQPINFNVCWNTTNETEMTKASDLIGMKRKVKNMFQRMNAQKRSELPKQRP